MPLLPECALTSRRKRSRNGVSKTTYMPADIESALVSPACNQKHVVSATIYADSSLVHEAGLGGWAYTVPALSLTGSGIALEPVWHSHDVELLALAMGVQRVRQDGYIIKKLHVFSDSSTVHSFVRMYMDGKRLDAKSGHEVLLLTELRACLGGTRFAVAPYRRGQPHHAWCHRAARAAVRTHIASNDALSTKLAMLRQSEAITSLLKCRERLLEKLADADRALERWQARCQRGQGNQDRKASTYCRSRVTYGSDTVASRGSIGSPVILNRIRAKSGCAGLRITLY